MDIYNIHGRFIWSFVCSFLYCCLRMLRFSCWKPYFFLGQKKEEKTLAKSFYFTCIICLQDWKVCRYKFEYKFVSYA